MADDEQFSLCWNNFNTNLSAGFHESLCRGDLVDVSLAAEGQIVKAHRLVLSVCSPFFRKMFTQMPPNAHAFVFLNNVSHSALKDLIQFMYCGEVNVKQDALPAFISTAESLQIKGLTDNDPAPQPPQEPTPPPPAAPHVQQQQQQVPTQRVQRQQPRASARYKIETVDDVLGDDKGTTQIVIQTTTAPQATIVQQQQQQQQQQQTQHIQTQQQLQTGTTTTATLVSTNKRTAQRGSLVGSGNVKRSKTTTTTANVIDPLDTTPDTATTTTTAQQLASQQITVQTTVVPSETKVHQVRQQQAAAQEEAEYIDLPMELPTKSEPDYSEDHAEVAGDGDTTYVEDDTYGDMRYDDSYFTENEDAGAQTAGGNTSAANVSATTSKAVVKQQSQSYSDSSFVDTGADQGNTEAQAFTIIPRVRNILAPSILRRDQQRVPVPRTTHKQLTASSPESPAKRRVIPTPSTVVAQSKLVPAHTKLSQSNPENIIRTAANNHKFVYVGVPRMKGKCVNCLKNGKTNLERIPTCCDSCPGSNWMCDACFDELH
ncbi:modifier of mdg4-like isoform X6 [Drosophila sulfurigaster albostrigata]|uniref:modifier of mdg4-like isoform X6 n=1 Tax=Drosophila sulfurigaster albostrigata TaxID=89887 RepID=UPI002D21B455|nr:modifier of mdg4-like isoform X6 [Drosophila sulfurigaster albostrigata]